METAEIWVVPHFGNNQARKNFLPQINTNKHRKACINVHLSSSVVLSKQTETLLRFEFYRLLAGCPPKTKAKRLQFIVSETALPKV